MTMFTAGELLLSEECVAAMVYRDVNPPCCSACLEPLDAKSELRCERCKVERYCSEACRRSGSRAYHSSKGECAAFEAALEAEETELRDAVNIDTTNTTTARGEGRFHFEDLPQRFLLRVLSQAGKWRAPGKAMTCTNVNDILALEAHVPPQDSPEHAWLSAISRNTLRLMDESVDEGVAFQPAATAQPDVDEGGRGGGWGEERRAVREKIEEEGASVCDDHFGVPQLTRLMCCVNCNSHTLYARDHRPLEPVGTAVYLQGSAFNHSCRPNAEFYNVGTSLRVHSVQHISAGEEVTVSYVPLTESLAERRRSLSRQYKFTCTCERCQQEERDEEKDDVKGGASKRIKR